MWEPYHSQDTCPPQMFQILDIMIAKWMFFPGVMFFLFTSFTSNYTNYTMPLQDPLRKKNEIRTWRIIDATWLSRELHDPT